MKKRKLKSFVLPSVYLISITILAIWITFLTKGFIAKHNLTNDEHYNYSMSVFDEDETQSTMEETPQNTKTVSKPFTDETVTIQKDFYKEEDTPENQEKALIYYQNTYMQNTGILYASENVFDVIAVVDGTIKEIKTDEILGNVLTIQTDNNITVVYYTLGDIKVKQGDKVKQNDIIATSGQSEIETTKQTLLFEVYINGTLTNPNTFFEKNIEELN